MKLEKFIVSESLEAPIDAGPGEEGRQKSNEDAYGDEKTRHLAPEKSGLTRKETSAVEEEMEYIDSYGIEAASTADGKTYLIGNFESFEDAKDFLEWELNHFEAINAKVIRHTERTSMEAIFTDRIEDFFHHKPPS